MPGPTVAVLRIRFALMNPSVSTSKAPISHTARPGLLASSRRGTPRWSVAGKARLDLSARAGLPGNIAGVGVWAPLNCRGASIGFVLIRSAVGSRLHVFALSRLFPGEMKRPEQLAAERAVLPATMVFFRV